MTRKLKHVFRALKSKNYRLYFAGQSISFVGNWIQQVAMGWLVYRMTNSVFMLGVIGFSAQLPAFIISPFVGVLSDKIDRRKILLFSQIGFMLQAGTLTFLVLTDYIQTWHIVALSFCLGAINGFEMTTRHSFFLDVIEKKEDLGNAIALNSAVFNGSRLVGPTIAGALIAVTGEGICFLINTISYAAVIISLLLIKTKKPKEKTILKDIRFFKEIREGIRYAFLHKPLRYIILIMLAVFIFALPFSIFLPAFAKDVLKGGPDTLGMMMSAMGAGALVGAIFLASRKSVVGLSHILVIAALLESISILIFCMSESIYISMLMLASAGAGIMIFNSSVNTLLQVLADEDKRGRVISIFIMAFTGMVPVGGLLQGWFDKIIGIQMTMFAGAVCAIICTIIFAFNVKKLKEMVRPIYIKKGVITKDSAFGGVVAVTTADVSNKKM